MPPELAVAYAGEELQLSMWYMYSHLLVILLVTPLILARVREAMRVNCHLAGAAFAIPRCHCTVVVVATDQFAAAGAPGGPFIDI